MNRRTLLSGSVAIAADSLFSIAAPNVARASEARWTIAIPVADFAKGDGKPAGEALQAALDAAFETGLPLVFPRGEWLVDRPLSIRHVERRRRGAPRLVGAGIGSTILRSSGFAEPLMSVLAGPLERPAGVYFLYGGGIEEIELVGAGPAAGAAQTCLEVRGWWYGALRNCLFQGFGAHGLRAVPNDIDPNPDWSASILRLQGCTFERIGGWGYLDDNPIGAPAWAFDRCIFNRCGAGGAFVRSSGVEFTGCSFAAAGFVENGVSSPAPKAVGLQIGDPAGSTINRTRISVAEFDANRDVHIVLDRSSSCLIEDARFIHLDRNRAGRITPPLAVELGTGARRSRLQNIRIVRPLVRIDQEGTVTGYRLAAPEGASDIVIDEESLQYNPAHKGEFTRTQGFPDADAMARAGIHVGR